MGRSLVLFDIDGTLLRGAGDHHKQALIDGIRRATGLETHLNGVPTSGMLDCDLVATMLHAAGHTRSLPPATLQTIFDECQSAYHASCTAPLTRFVCPGVPQLLADLQARGAILGLVTGNLSRIAWRKMELAGLRPYFSLGAFAEEASTRAELARLAARHALDCGLIPAAAPISLIGDHPNDIHAGRVNGFRSVAVATGFTPPAELAAASPDILVPTLLDLDPAMLF